MTPNQGKKDGLVPERPQCLTNLNASNWHHFLIHTLKPLICSCLADPAFGTGSTSKNTSFEALLFNFPPRNLFFFLQTYVTTLPIVIDAQRAQLQTPPQHKLATYLYSTWFLQPGRQVTGSQNTSHRSTLHISNNQIRTQHEAEKFQWRQEITQNDKLYP